MTHCAAQPVSPPAPDTKSAYLAIVATAGERCFIARGLNFTANDAGKLIRVEHIGSFERWYVSRIASVIVQEQLSRIRDTKPQLHRMREMVDEVNSRRMLSWMRRTPLSR